LRSTVSAVGRCRMDQKTWLLGDFRRRPPRDADRDRSAVS
jgi:hypothetical protein